MLEDGDGGDESECQRPEEITFPPKGKPPVARQPSRSHHSRSDRRDTDASLSLKVRVVQGIRFSLYLAERRFRAPLGRHCASRRSTFVSSYAKRTMTRDPFDETLTLAALGCLLRDTDRWSLCSTDARPSGDDLENPLPAAE